MRRFAIVTAAVLTGGLFLVSPAATAAVHPAKANDFNGDGAAEYNDDFGPYGGATRRHQGRPGGPDVSAPHDQGLVLLTGAAGGATTSGAREIKPVGDTGDYPLPITG